MKRWLYILFLLLPSCIFHKHAQQTTDPDQRTAITVTIKANNLTEDGTISTHNDEIFCALLNTSADSSSRVELLGCDMFTLDSVWQEYKFTAVPPDLNATGDLSLVLIEMDTDSSKSAMSRTVHDHYYELAHALKVNDQKTISHILGDDDLLGIRAFAIDPLLKGKSLWVDIDGQQFFNHYSFTVTLDPWEILLPQD
ncbi:MAG TPA: hypothetical protein VL651_00315 [Bacteroidia bacterium]|nr:hypothetical protein [Bacteroidia bacterium]